MRPQPNHICETPEACECSSSGEECCCVFGPDGSCMGCGADAVIVDLETGAALDERALALFA